RGRRLSCTAVHGLSSTTGIVALAAAGVAVVALAGAIALALRLRRLQAAQRIVLGGDGARDLVDHAAELQGAFRTLNGYVEDVAARLHSRMDGAEQRLDGAIAYRGLVRYDAYGEMS